MEELRQQVRRSALWRFWGFWGFVVALVITFLFSIHTQNASKGIADVDALKQKNKTERGDWRKEREALEKKKLQLIKDLRDCKENNDPEKKLADCEDKILLVEDEIEILNTDLQRCESKLLQLTN
mgnify:CR=1 FL=1